MRPLVLLVISVMLVVESPIAQPTASGSAATGALGSPSRGSRAETSPGEQANENGCQSSDLHAAIDANGAGGWLMVAVQLVNTSSTPCYLTGYPKVALLDGTGTELPFAYIDQPTPYLPMRIELSPGSVANVTITKYRCDQGNLAIANTVQITPPGAATPLEMNLSGAGLGFCGTTAPGSTVYITPVWAASQETPSASTSS